MFLFSKTQSGLQAHFAGDRARGVAARVEALAAVTEADPRGKQVERLVELPREQWSVTFGMVLTVPELEAFAKELPAAAL